MQPVQQKLFGDDEAFDKPKTDTPAEGEAAVDNPNTSVQQQQNTAPNPVSFNNTFLEPAKPAAPVNPPVPPMPAMQR